MRTICIALCLAAALLSPSAAGASRTAWMPPLSRTADSAARLSAQLAVLARARASVKTPELTRTAPELPRTGGEPGLIALCGLGLGLAGAGARRLRPPL